MKAVIIGASQEALHTIQKAHDHGIQVAALDGHSDAAGLSVADQGLVVDISQEHATIEAVRKEQPDFVLTVPIGRYLTTIGAVNDALSLPGISREMAVLCTDKYRFHERLAEHGLRDCHCYAVGKERTVTDEFLINFPAILKPRYGSGSRGIHMVNHQQELAAALEQTKGEEYVLEDCVPGEEYGVDGAVIQGQFHMVLLRKKVNTPPPARQAVGYFACMEDDVFGQQVYEYMVRIVRCLGLQECLLHGDFIRGAKGPFVIELSARPSGHNLHNLFTPLCTGVDMAEEYIKYRIGESYSFEPKCIRPMMIHYFDGQGRINKIPDKAEIECLLEERDLNAKGEQVKLIDWQCNMTEGGILSPVSDGHSIMGRGYYILEGNSEQSMLELAGEIMERFFRKGIVV